MNESNMVIIGSNGQLGRALQELYPASRTVDINELDITNEEQVENFNWGETTSIINAAAYTNVDLAETEAGREMAWRVNSNAVANLARVAMQNEITLVHISTDYVFDGTKANHKEDEPFTPLSVYGTSKAAGDIVAGLVEKHYILRTSWVIGDGNNFVRTMLDLAKRNINPTVVADQIGRPTFTDELVKAIDHLLINNAPYGTYNVSNDGPPVSWADFARLIFELSNHNIVVTDATTSEYFAGKKDIAPRPLESTFDLSKIKSIGFEPNDWQKSLKRYIEKEKNEQ